MFDDDDDCGVESLVAKWNRENSLGLRWVIVEVVLGRVGIQ